MGGSRAAGRPTGDHAALPGDTLGQGLRTPQPWVPSFEGDPRFIGPVSNSVMAEFPIKVLLGD